MDARWGQGASPGSTERTPLPLASCPGRWRTAARVAGMVFSRLSSCRCGRPLRGHGRPAAGTDRERVRRATWLPSNDNDICPQALLRAGAPTGGQRAPVFVARKTLAPAQLRLTLFEHVVGIKWNRKEGRGLPLGREGAPRGRYRGGQSWATRPRRPQRVWGKSRSRRRRC